MVFNWPLSASDITNSTDFGYYSPFSYDPWQYWAKLQAEARRYAKYLLSIAHPPLSHPKRLQKRRIRPKNAKIWLWTRYLTNSPPFYRSNSPNHRKSV